MKVPHSLFALALLVLALTFPSALPTQATVFFLEPTATGTPLPATASPVNIQATPASVGQPPGSLAGLREQGITPAVLLAGDLLLLIVALIIVIIDMRRRPRGR